MIFAIETTGGQRIVVRDRSIAPPDTPVDFTVNAGDALVSPGLINCHDHLLLNHYGRLGAPPYPDVYAWAEDVQRSNAERIARGKQVERSAAARCGALKNLLGGVTAVLHHDVWCSAFDDRFPIHVVRTHHAHTLRLARDLASRMEAWRAEVALPFSLHLAEGVGPAMADEVREAAHLGLLQAGLLAVHAVGVDADGVRRLAAAGAAVVWCPTSNLFLYGATLPPTIATAGVDVLLGTDSLLSGDGTLLRELHVARAAGLLSDTDLLAAVGERAARRLGLPYGLKPGNPADLVVWRRPILDATIADVGLVVVAGRPRLGDDEYWNLFGRTATETRALRVGPVVKQVEASLVRALEVAMHQSPACSILSVD